MFHDTKDASDTKAFPAILEAKKLISWSELPKTPENWSIKRKNKEKNDANKKKGNKKELLVLCFSKLVLNKESHCL